MTDAPLIRPGHLFSQHSLATFVRCPRRFLLKYIDRQPWPMPEGQEPETYEAQLARGRVFHQWMVRRVRGVPMDGIAAACEDADLRRWWHAVASFPWETLTAPQHEPELPVVVALGSYRLYARYDLLVLDPGGDATIVDWKSLETRPSAHVMTTRLQTRIYLYTLVAAGAALTGGAGVDPTRARMIYWFANYPDQTAIVPYGNADYDRDEERLHGLVKRIAAMSRLDFAPTADSRQCARCNYRSLCRPSCLASDVAAAEAGWLEEDLDASLDLGTVPDLEY